MINATQLSKSYRQTEVFSNLSLQVPEGHFAAIMGESGSGKTTLLNLIAGLDQPDRGSLKVAGVELFGKSSNQLTDFRRHHLAMIFQDFHLIASLTALENLILPLRLAGHRVDKQKLRAWLEQVGLAEKQHHLPQQMSGGEQQRVAIARALALEPAVLLADEPTGNLDHKNAQLVMELLKGLQTEQKLTLVMVTHSEKAAQYADQVFRMESAQWQ